MAADSLFTLDELAIQVGRNVGAVDDASLDQAKQWINRALLRFSEMGMWSWQREYGVSFSTIASTETINVTNTLKIMSVYMSTPVQRKLTLIEDREFRSRYPNPTATGSPYLWRTAGQSSSTVNTFIVGLYPIPDAVYTVKMDVIRPITLLTSDSQDIRTTSKIPVNLVDLVIEMATAIGMKQDDDKKARAQMEECMTRLSAAYSDDTYQTDDRLIMRSFDVPDDFSFQDPVLPPQYGPWW